MIKSCYSIFVTAILCVAFSFGTFTNVFSQTHTARTVAVNANCGGFYEYLPAGYAASTKQYPVIIAFHGAGSYGTGSTSDLAKVLREQVAFYINRGSFPASFTVGGETSSFIVISPQLRAAATPADINGIVTYVLNTYKVDRGRVYLSGYSAGANHVFKYAAGSLAYAQQITALTTMAIYNYPYSDAGSQYIAQAEVSLWAIHSSGDQTAPSTMSSNMVNKINSYNPLKPAIIRISSGLSHVQSDTAFCNPSFRPNGVNIYEWFLSKRRNFPPIARAGADIQIALPANSVSLIGSASSDPENSTLTYQWSKISGPGAINIATAGSANTSVNNMVAGTYRFELLVTDNFSLQSRDTIQVNVSNPFGNVLPIANAGLDQSITLPQNTVTLSGTGSTDLGGTIESYSWQQVSGPDGVQILAPTASSTQVTLSKKGTYNFTLTVIDNENGVSVDQVEIAVINPFPNIAPKANAGIDQEVTLPVNIVSLSGLASSDQDGNLVQYEWSTLYGPAGAVIVAPGSATTSVGNLNTGTYGFRLKVTDDNGAFGLDTIVVKVNPIAQIINRNLKVNVFGGTNPYTLDRWNNWNIGTGSKSNVTSSNFVYEDDGTNSNISATLSYSENIADNGANYGGVMCPPQVLRYASWSTTNRSLTIKGLNNSLKYNLQFFASRANTGNSTTFTISSTTKSVLTDNNKTNSVVFQNLQPANGQIVVTIARQNTYNYLNGFTIVEQAPDTRPNLLPTALASADSITIRVPSSAITLRSSGSSDSDGSIAAYEWSKISGPSPFNISNPFAPSTSVTSLVQGNYQFQLKVTDNRGGFGLDTIEIVVLPPLFQKPTATATSPSMVMMPQTSVTLTGSASTDIDGVITSYNWRQVQGNAAVLSGSNLAVATVQNLALGEYEFELTVVDNDGMSGLDTARFVVLPDMYPVPPVVDISNCNQPITIVVLGGSNAIGTGASPLDSSWIKKLEKYLKGKNNNSSVINYSVAGNNSYAALNPNGFVPLAGRPLPNTTLNITKALSINPNAIIINLPENDFDLGFSLSEQQSNYQRAIVEAKKRNIPVWITTPQPETNASSSKIIQQQAMQQWMQAEFGNKVIDFWTTLANASGTLDGLYRYDDKHVNNFGHHLFYTRVLSHRLVDTLCSRPLPNNVPVVNAGADTTIKSPANTILLNGIISDIDDTNHLVNWSQISGPNQAQIEDASNVSTQVNGLVIGLYKLRLQATDMYGASSDDTLTVNVIAANLPPIANAGADQIILLPVNSATVNGGLSVDTDGVIAGYEWKYISGPGAYTIQSANQSQTSVAGLVQGTYIFELKVVDNEGSINTDQVQIKVKPVPVSPKKIQVNLFDGSTPYNNTQWNNWQISSSSVSHTSQVLNYDDGTSTNTVSAYLNNTLGMSDNGSTYGGTMCPPEVLRFTSYATVSPRTLRISGLKDDRMYNLDLFASRSGATDNKTRFTVNSQEQTITTGNNKDVSAKFNYLQSSGGVLNVTIEKITSYTYLNGFILTESAPVGDNMLPLANAGQDIVLVSPQNATTLNGSASSDPDGTISKFLWYKINGPAGLMFNNDEIANPTITGLVQGSYLLELLVIDNEGGAKRDTLRVTVSPTLQVLPVANAGIDRQIYLPENSVSLSGNASFDADGSIVSYNWSTLSGPGNAVIDHPSSVSTTVSGLVPGDYDFMLTVTDNIGQQSTDIVRISVGQDLFLPPVIRDSLNCGKKVKIVVIGSSTAAGNGASPIDSSWVRKFTAYVKSVNSQSEVINLAAASQTTYQICNPDGFVPPNGRPYPDGAKNITKALSYQPNAIIVNLPSNDTWLSYTQDEQKANYERMMSKADSAGVPVWVTTTQPRSPFELSKRIELQQIRDWTYTRFGSKAIDFWSTLAESDGTIAALYNADNVHVNNYGHHLLFSRVVGEHILDSLCIRANNAPTVSAGDDIVIQLPTNSVQLTGVAADADGTISTMNWTNLSGPSVANVSNPAAASTNVTGLLAGTYVFRFSAVDNYGATDSDSMTVTVQPVITNKAPSVNAGNDIIISLPQSSVSLNCVANDEDGTIVSYSWHQMQGPNTANISDNQLVSPVVSGLIQGSYVFSITVIDNEGSTATDLIAIQVNGPVNTAPLVSASSNLTISLPVSSVQLNGSATDAENNISTYLWTFVSGPASYNIVSVNQPSSVVNGLVQGTYIFRLTVTDALGASGFANVTITVNPTVPVYSRQRILIDFGQPSTITGATVPDQFGKYWNNVTDARPGIRLTNAKDSANGTTTLGFEVINRIDGTFGVTGTGMNFGNLSVAVGDYPGSAVEDNAFAHSSTTVGSWRIFGLDPLRIYTFKFWGTRTGSGTRIIQVKDSRVSTWSEEFNSINNTNYNQACFIRNISGVTEITFDIRCKPGQNYGNISVVDITSELVPQTMIVAINTVTNTSVVSKFVPVEKKATSSKADSKLSLYPNPVKDLVYLQFANDYKGPLQVQVVNTVGTVLASHSFAKSTTVFESRIPVHLLPVGRYQVVIIGSSFRLANALMKY